MIIDGKNYSWTQPLCETCWKTTGLEFIPNRIASGFRQEEKCAKCGDQHQSGIYMRIDPRDVPYPALKD